MQPWTAYLSIVSLALIFTILTAQFVYREAEVFQRTWPRYEDRIASSLAMWMPQLAADLFGEPATTEGGSAVSHDAGLTPPRSGGDVRGRTSLTDLFRITSQDVLQYVFSHSLDVAELIVSVFCYLVFLFLGSRKLKGRLRRAFPRERSTRLVAIGDGITESMERFMVVKTATGVGMAVSAAIIMSGFGLDHWMLWVFLFFALKKWIVGMATEYGRQMSAKVPLTGLSFAPTELGKGQRRLRARRQGTGTLRTARRARRPASSTCGPCRA